jgi:hypothetical protein
MRKFFATQNYNKGQVTLIYRRLRKMGKRKAKVPIVKNKGTKDVN